MFAIQVLLDSDVTADCVYKIGRDNFHLYKDENGKEFGLGFHWSQKFGCFFSKDVN